MRSGLGFLVVGCLALFALPAAAQDADLLTTTYEPVDAETSEYDFYTLLEPNHPLVEAIPELRDRGARSSGFFRWRQHYIPEILRAAEDLF